MAALSFKKGFSTGTLAEFGREPLLLVLKLQLNVGHPLPASPYARIKPTPSTTTLIASTNAPTMVLLTAPVQVTPNPWFWLLAFVTSHGPLAFIREDAGYAAYLRQVRWRWFPGIA